MEIDFREKFSKMKRERYAKNGIHSTRHRRCNRNERRDMREKPDRGSKVTLLVGEHSFLLSMRAIFVVFLSHSPSLNTVITNSLI